MGNLLILKDTAVTHLDFGWFNLAVPNILFWIAVVALFALFTWVRIPLFMEADAAARAEEASK